MSHVPCPFLFLVAAVPHKAIREDTFQRQLSFLTLLLSRQLTPKPCMWLLRLNARSCITIFRHLQRDGISNDGVTTTYSWGRISKLGPTCESQSQGINCHADDFWVHGVYAWSTNLQLSWYKRTSNRRELSLCWELQSFHQSRWKNKFLSRQRMQATFYHASLHLPCSLLQWLWQAQKWQASGVWLGGVCHNSIKQ